MQSPQENVGTLQQLIAGRHALAQTMGCLSFSQYTLAGASLAGTPAAVDAFLNTLSTALHPKVSRMRAMLSQISHGGMNPCSALAVAYLWARPA